MSHDQPNTRICRVRKSGSMQQWYSHALECVNEYIYHAQRDPELCEARFSLIMFNSEERWRYLTHPAGVPVWAAADPASANLT